MLNHHEQITEQQEVKNAFDLPIYEIKDVLKDPEIEAVIMVW